MRKKKEKISKRSEGKLPVNSRITIDYTKKKPTVRFSYPRKNVLSQVRNTRINLYLSMAMVILIMVCTVYFVRPAWDYDVYYGDCEAQLYGVEFENKSMWKGISVTCDGEHNNLSLTRTAFGFPVTYRPYSTPQGIQFETTVLLVIFSCILYFSVFSFIGPLIIKHTGLHKRIPESQAKVAMKRGYTATFKKVPITKTLEIPLFGNLYLDYEASGEFSKYLEKVEIKEHPFKRFVRRRGKKKKAKKNQYIHWFAMFHFSEIPKTGKLEVDFR